MKIVRWGVLGTAKIAREKVIPAMQAGEHGKIMAIASRTPGQAKEVADRLGIPLWYGSYEELLNDPDIDAVYIPLPNHLHVPWAVKAVRANKHVLCEKPIGLSVAEAKTLQDTAEQKPHLKVMEAFMYRYHPQWQLARKLVNEGTIGKLKMVQSFFSYYNADPANIRNNKEAGGGGLMDIGCYCISQARYLFGREPHRVSGIVEVDPSSQTDRLTSGILDFETGTATFTCSTQLMPYQKVHIFGTEGHIEVEVPVNVPPDQPSRIWLHTKCGRKEFVFPAVDQYTLQGNLMSKAILDNTPVPTSLQDAIDNMQVIEAVFQSASQGRWVTVAVEK